MVNLVDEAVANVIGRKRAYGYIRTSSDAQDTASSAARQKHNIEKRSVELNFYVEEYFQEVASGLNVEDRATFLLMIEKALKRENNVSAIFCDDLSRFTRSDKDPYKYVDMLLEKDIVLITVKEGSSDNIRDRRAWKHQYSTNSDYIEDLSLWTMDGLATSVRAGHFPFQPPYGYIRYYFVGESERRPPFGEATTRL